MPNLKFVYQSFYFVKISLLFRAYKNYFKFEYFLFYLENMRY
ncbi:hypothetical protein ATCC51561_169 [Campylobacter concisus ATCC 51561]|nr:hypothetical protein ATCC51561_169 [Campylobacter concisus ATCC 51561]